MADNYSIATSHNLILKSNSAGESRTRKTRIKFVVGICIIVCTRPKSGWLACVFLFFGPYYDHIYYGGVTTSADLTTYYIITVFVVLGFSFLYFIRCRNLIFVLARKQSCFLFVVNAAHVSPVTATRHDGS